MNITTISEVTDYFKTLFEEAQDNKIAVTGTCHDCDAEVTINADWDLETGETVIDGNGAFYKINTESRALLFFKCKDCYEKDPVLRNYMPTEIYSRVTGYIRPVKQWNKGKQEEFEIRKSFKVLDEE